MSVVINETPLVGCPFVPCANLATAKLYKEQAEKGETDFYDWYQNNESNRTAFAACRYFVCLLN